jgi:hypothetical protein
MSSGVELLSNGLRALERLQRAFFVGAPSLPFYRPREGPMVHEREREGKEKIEKIEKRALEPCHPSLMGGSRWWCRR